MLQGLMMAIGGGLLFLPGFISDVLALIVLFPPTRNFLFRQINRRMEAQMRRQRASPTTCRPAPTRNGPM